MAKEPARQIASGVVDLGAGVRLSCIRYDDQSIRIRLYGIGPVVVDELFISSKEPMIRVRPDRFNKEVESGEEVTSSGS